MPYVLCKRKVFEMETISLNKIFLYFWSLLHRTHSVQHNQLFLFYVFLGGTLLYNMIWVGQGATNTHNI